GRASVPPIEGLNEAGYLTNETLFSLTELPAALAIIGGGPIGCEIAQAFARLGSKVWIVEAAPVLLGREHPDAAAIVERALRRDGVEVLLESQVKRVERNGATKSLLVKTAQDERNLSVDAVLVTVGRIPNVSGLGLE